jgi:pSer/pThr/pTyr-binding forkhead associated (FHA) protein
MGVLQHLSSGKNITLAASSSVGRSPDCFLLLSHLAVSKQHASLFWTGQRWVVRDSASANGTYLDNEKLIGGEDYPLRSESILRFGSDEEQWKLVDDRGPVAMAKCLETGLERYGESGVLSLPDDDNVLITITKGDDGQFVLDQGDENRREIVTGERLLIEGQTWILTLPPATPIAGTYKQPLRLSLKTTQINLYVSRDQEHVRVEIVHDGGKIDLGRRACFCALHVLAKQRIDDEKAGELAEEECGWMEVEDLRRETAESETALNLSVKRIREEFKEAGVEDGKALIDTTSRRGKRRLTTNRIEILPG